MRRLAVFALMLFSATPAHAFAVRAEFVAGWKIEAVMQAGLFSDCRMSRRLADGRRLVFTQAQAQKGWLGVHKDASGAALASVEATLGLNADEAAALWQAGTVRLADADGAADYPLPDAARAFARVQRCLAQYAPDNAAPRFASSTP